MIIMEEIIRTTEWYLVLTADVGLRTKQLKSESKLNSILLARWRGTFSGGSKDYVSTFIATGLIEIFGIITGILTARLLGPVGKR